MFKNLQAKFDGRTELPIEIQEICDALVEMGYQDDIRVVGEEMDLDQLLGTYVQFTEPSGGTYSEPRLVSLIIYPTNIDLASRRIVCAKELVHVCDANVAQTNNANDIMELAMVLAGQASIGDEPRMTMKVAADILAQQKGLMLLFPKAARVIARQKVADGQITLEDLAGKLMLPCSTVEDMLDDDWDTLADAVAQF
ncbi:hypothetical protein [Meridianimarinicoccus aquatilis]|uniref:IrrE N-terminal-like domain-containing protein n=1 Tax=Meridianimarinicoccus aquatilis TaxID=2552766 RepID=A0A4R6ATV6_9RHOB|nr:hypothetical protein [Fluviibacterium aquatile]TDL88021.1 hypothetical protein E2L05_09750 [Fluviibacterium aquatile]